MSGQERVKVRHLGVRSVEYKGNRTRAVLALGYRVITAIYSYT